MAKNSAKNSKHQQNRAGRPPHGAPVPQQAARAAAAAGGAQRQYAGARISGVPGLDAFKNLPQREPPSLPGYEAERAAYHSAQFDAVGQQAPPCRKKAGARASGVDGAPTRSEARAQEARAKRAQKPLNPAKRRRNRQIIAAVLFVGLLGAGVLFSFKVLFKIDKYVVEGNVPYTQEEIVMAFGRDLGDNMFGFNVGNAVRRLEKNLPYLENTKISRRLPGTVVFKVQAAEEAYCAEYDGEYAVLSKSCKVLRIADEAPGGVTEIRGLTDVVMEPGKTVAEAPQEKGKKAFSAKAASGKAKFAAGDAAHKDVDAENRDGEKEASASAANGVPSAAAGAPADSAEPVLEEVTSLGVLQLMLEKLSAHGFENITWLDITNPIDLQFRWDGRITVDLGGRANVDDKLKFAAALMLEGDTRQIADSDKGTLDVSTYPTQSDMVWLRPEY